MAAYCGAELLWGVWGGMALEACNKGQEGNVCRPRAEWRWNGVRCLAQKVQAGWSWMSEMRRCPKVPSQGGCQINPIKVRRLPAFR